ncbi:uncharacterized [Tachysurus ichikawai]
MNQRTCNAVYYIFKKARYLGSSPLFLRLRRVRRAFTSPGAHIVAHSLLERLVARAVCKPGACRRGKLRLEIPQE